MSDMGKSSRSRPAKPRRDVYQTHRGGGFTILECLLAGVVMALFGVTLAGGVVQSGIAQQRAEDRRAAARWLDQTLTRIDMIGPARLAVEGPTSGPLDDRFSWSANITEDAVFPDLYIVSVTVQITGSDGRPAGAVRGYTQFHDPVGARARGLMWEDTLP